VPDIVIHVVASALYAGLALHFWSTRWRALPAVRAPASSPAAGGLSAWERAAILLPMAIHGALLYAELFARGELRLGFAFALSGMLWIAVLIYWVESFFYALDALQVPTLAFAAMTVPLPAIFPGRIAVQYAGSVEFVMHVALGMLAYGVLVVAILHVGLMTFVERILHRPRNSSLIRLPIFPPLLTLERMLFGMIALAFILFTFTLGMGIAFSESIYGKAFRFDHKTFFSLLTWLTLAILLAGRYIRGWRGRTALLWVMAAFVFLMLAYVGKSFVLEVILGRT